MLAEIICVGNELLYGDTLNTNTQYLSQQLAMIGVDVQYQLVVGDDEPKLIAAIELASGRSDIVIFSGGLGPTYDDMTKETLAKTLGQAMVLDEPSLEAIKGFFARLGRDMKDSNNKQAYRPIGGVSLPNSNGTAPGIYVKSEDTHYFLLPGPPRELMPMYMEQVRPRLVELTKGVITSKIFSLAGIGESDLAVKIGHIMDHSDNPRIAPYVKIGTVNIRLTAKSDTSEQGQVLIEAAEKEILPYIGPYVYSEQGEDIEEVVIGLLKDKQLTVSAAESCTGGLFSSRLINIPGASEVYMNGFVTYSNEAKMKWLDVSEADLIAHGAVSEVVALAMAEGVRRTSGTDFGVGITGIAGPGGGTAEKPVGTVCIAIAGNDGNKAATHRFSGNRQKVRELSAQYALVALYRYLASGK